MSSLNFSSSQAGAMMPYVRICRVAVVSLIIVGCADSDVIYSPPVNPAISNIEGIGMATLPLRVDCEGPAEDLAVLGGICGNRTDNLGWWKTDAPAGMALWIGPQSGPLILLYNWLGYEPDYRKNVAGEVQYSAYVLREGAPESGFSSTLNAWDRAESVTNGDVITYWARFSCSGSWYGEGTFQWRSTTLKFAWLAGKGC